MDWSETTSYMKGITNKLSVLHTPVRIAAFDLDDTLIYYPSKSKFNSKIKLVSNKIGSDIKNLVDKNYLIIIITNQSGMSFNKNFDKISWKRAIDELHNIIFKNINEYYFAVYAAKMDDYNRKPNLGLWYMMKHDIEELFSIDKIGISKNSFYCGDAGGRIYPGKIKKEIHPKSKGGDFSDSDRKFAINIGINYLTPEDFFYKNLPKIKFKLSGIAPDKILEYNKSNYKFKPNKKEMIIMVGMPGSGKSEFVKNFILPHNYVHINQDKYRSSKKCIDLTKKAINENKSVVIDNTNLNITARHPYTTLAEENKYILRAIIINTPEDIAKHMNNVRHVYSKGTIPKISNIVYNIYKKNYIKPHQIEKFDAIEEIDFVFDDKMLSDKRWKNIFFKLS